MQPAVIADALGIDRVRQDDRRRQRRVGRAVIGADILVDGDEAVDLRQAGFVDASMRLQLRARGIGEIVVDLVRLVDHAASEPLLQRDAGGQRSDLVALHDIRSVFLADLDEGVGAGILDMTPGIGLDQPAAPLRTGCQQSF